MFTPHQPHDGFSFMAPTLFRSIVNGTCLVLVAVWGDGQWVHGGEEGAGSGGPTFIFGDDFEAGQQLIIAPGTQVIGAAETGFAEDILITGAENFSRLNVNSSLSLPGRVTLDPRNVFRNVWFSTQGIHVSANASLTLEQPLEYFGGVLQGSFLGQQELHKMSAGPGWLIDIGSSYDRIFVDGGTLEVTGAVDAATQLHVSPSSPSAQLRLMDAGDVWAPIYLHNAQRPLETRGDTILRGDVFLGEQGATLDGGEITGRIHGGDLRVFGDQFLRSSGHTYTGVTRIESRSFVLLDEAALTTTSELIIGKFPGALGLLALDNRNLASGNRIGDDIPITMEYGQITLYGNDKVATLERVGSVTIQSAVQISVENPSSDAVVDTVLEIDQLIREPGATIRFETNGNSRIMFSNPPPLDDGLIGSWAFPDGFDFATYGPDGVVPYASLYTYESDLNAAGPTSNVSLSENDPVVMDSSTTVNALRMRGTLDLANETLTIDSGALLNRDGRVHGGSLTAGAAVGELLISYGYLLVDANIVDNGLQPIGLTVSEGAAELSGTNTYSGPTRLTRSGHIKVTHPQALPQGTDLFLQGGRVEIDYASTTPIVTGDIVFRGDGVIYGVAGAPPIDAQTYSLESGVIDLEIQGTGRIEKTGLGSAVLGQSNPNYGGQIVVEEGMLTTNALLGLGQAPLNESHAVIVHSRGVVKSTSLLRGRMVILEGGELIAGTADILLEVRAPSYVTGIRSSTLAGTIVGSGDLTVNGPFEVDSIHESLQITADLNQYAGDLRVTGGEVHVFGDNSDFGGIVDVTAQTVSVGGSPYALGTGEVRIHDGGLLRMSTPLEANVLLDDGDLRFLNEFGVLSGTLFVERNTRVFIGTDGTFKERGEIASEMTLADGAQIHLVPDVMRDLQDSLESTGTLAITNRMTLQGDARISAYFATLEFDGVLASAGAAALDLVDLEDPDGFSLNPSLDVPAGTSLSVTTNLGSETVDLIVNGPSKFLAGGGTLHNDVTIQDDAVIRPGDSTARLLINGDLQLDDARLTVELAGTTPELDYDVLHVSGNFVNLSGRIEAELNEGFVPSPGDRFTVLQVDGDISGDPIEVLLPTVDASIAWEVEMNAHNVSLLALFAADFDADGDVDGEDFLAWQLGFGINGDADRPDGDANGDGNVDGLDFLIWQESFGDQANVLAVHVPEPSTGATLLICGGLIVLRRRRQLPRRLVSSPISVRFATFVLAVNLFAGGSAGQDIVWNGPIGFTGDWLDPANWTPPSPSDFFQFTINVNGTAHLSNGTVRGELGNIAPNHRGTVLQTGGLLDLDVTRGLLDIARGASARGTYRLQGGELRTERIFLGEHGRGTFELEGGRLVLGGAMNVGSSDGGVGTFRHSGGLFEEWPAGSQTQIRIGQFNVADGLYELSGNAQLRHADIDLQRGRFNQFGGVADLHGTIRIVGLEQQPSVYSLESGVLRTSNVRLDGGGMTESSTTLFEQFEAVADIGAVSISHGEYRMAGGTLDADSIGVAGSVPNHRPTSFGLFLQTGGAVEVDRLTVSGDTSSDRVSEGLYDLAAGSLTAGRLFVASEYVATFRQRNGDVRVRDFEVRGLISQGGQATYRMEDGSLHIDWTMSLAGDGPDEQAVLDLASQPARISTGLGSRIVLGQNATIVDAHNANLAIGADSLVVLPTGVSFADFSNQFANVEHHDVVVASEDQQINVGPQQRVQIGGEDWSGGLVVHGLAYDTTGFSLDLSGGLRVESGGRLELARFAFALIQEDTDSAVRGGTASLGGLVLRDSSEFIVEQQGQLNSTDFLWIDSNNSLDVQFTLRSGQLAANRLFLTGAGALFLQEDGQTLAQRVVVGADDGFSSGGLGLATAQIEGGSFETDELRIVGQSTFQQQGSSSVEVGYLDLDNGTYLHSGGTLAVDRRLRISKDAQLDFAVSHAEVEIRGAIVDLGSEFRIFNADQATLTIDDHSLVITPAAGLLEAAFSNVTNDGLVHVLGSPLTIPAGRVIRGDGELTSAASRVTIEGTLIAKQDGISVTKFDVVPGAVADLGEGTAWSLSPGGGGVGPSTISGGSLTARTLVIDGTAGVFTHTGGDARFERFVIRNNSAYEISGGSLTVGQLLDDGILDMENSDARLIVDSGATLRLDDLLLFNSFNASLEGRLDSLIILDPGFDLDFRFGQFSAEGMVHVNGSTLEIPGDQTLRGELRLNDGIESDGTVSPGFSIGELVLSGVESDFRQTSTGTLIIEMGWADNGSGEADRLSVGGDAWLDGELDVRFLDDDFEPRYGEVFTILSATAIHGEFANAPGVVTVPGGGLFDLVIEHGEVQLTNYRVPVLTADFDLDGDVDGEDFLVWQLNFGTTTGATLADGDADRDSDVDGEDFLIWQTQLGQVSTRRAVSAPEPSTSLLSILLLAAPPLARGRVRRHF